MAGRQADFGPTDLYHFVKTIPNLCQVQEVTDWDKVAELTFSVLDCIHTDAVQARVNQEVVGKLEIDHVTSGGAKALFLREKSHLKDAAFKAGVDVVVWTQPRNGSFYVGVAVNALLANSSERDIQRRTTVDLNSVIVVLRFAEAQRRGLGVTDADLIVEYSAKVPGWFLHDSGKLILCGSGTHPLKEEEYTKLTPDEIFTVVKIGLG